jgi:hypothetical protein
MMSIRTRAFATVSVIAGSATTFLVVLLGHPVLADLMHESGPFLAWVCASVLSLCFAVSAVAALVCSLSGRGWCWPAYLVGGIYMTTLVAAFSSRAQSHGASTVVVLFSLYCTSIPFQLALLTRRLVEGRSPLPDLVGFLVVPGARSAEHDHLEPARTPTRIT